MEESELASNLKVTARVYNYAQVPRGVLAQAQSEARRILGEVGIEMAWVACPLSADEAERNPVCRQELRATDLVVRIQPRFDALHASFQDTTLGFAPLKEGERGSYASVFYDRVTALAAGGDFPPSQILGHAIAHEIGHLLLRTMTHSPAGLMRAQWGRDDLERAQIGHLLFTPDQAELIRVEVSVRSAEQEQISRLAETK